MVSVSGAAGWARQCGGQAGAAAGLRVLAGRLPVAVRAGGRVLPGCCILRGEGPLVPSPELQGCPAGPSPSRRCVPVQPSLISQCPSSPWAGLAL